MLDKSAKRARGQARHQHTSEPQRVQDRVGMLAGQLAAKDIEIDMDIVSYDDDLVGQEPGDRVADRVEGGLIGDVGRTSHDLGSPMTPPLIGTAANSTRPGGRAHYPRRRRRGNAAHSRVSRSRGTGLMVGHERPRMPHVPDAVGMANAIPAVSRTPLNMIERQPGLAVFDNLA